jgi:hypothetical protein
VHRGGHALHTALAAEVLRQRDAWRLVDLASTEAAAARSGIRVPANQPVGH